VTIRFSHFNEKARWALDHFRVAYEERAYMPGLHALGALSLAPRHGLGRADRISTPLATPILVTDDGRCVRDSSAIVRYVSDRYAAKGEGLYPTPEVATLDDRFSKSFGPHTRRVVYFHAFSAPELLRRSADENVGPTQARWFKRVYPLVERLIAKRLGVNPERAAHSLEKCRAEIDEVSRRIEGRRYLVGDRFTAADLAFACMAAPLILPSREEGYGAHLPEIEACPPAFVDIIRETRATPAGQFALRLFREERGERQTPCVV
jgi:glutathione S-transferase